jgi:hypothetical protein
MIRLIGILIMVAGAVQQPTPADAQRHQDAYAIYSAMMSYPPSAILKDKDDGKSGLIIASVTTPAMTNSPCITPSREYASRWTEVLADFNARSNTPATLEPDLKISRPYVYLKPDEVSALMILQRSAPETQERKEVFAFSDVYFDKNRTLALTGVRVWCGNMCFTAMWMIYEKGSNGIWKQVRPEKNCYVVA